MIRPGLSHMFMYGFFFDKGLDITIASCRPCRGACDAAHGRMYAWQFI